MARLFPARAQFLGAYTGEVPGSPLPEIVFAGRSNVGKSSAINTIVGQAIARTSSTPGRTQSINVFEVGGRIHLVDLPGYGFAKVGKHTRDDWKRMIGHYFTSRETIRLVVALFDSRHPAQDLDRTLLESLAAYGFPVLGLATKVDDLPKARRDNTVATLARAHGLPDDAVIPFSATERIGLEEAREAIASVL
ncbi:MAG: ribosome biogenesis GTP-binding protein YsxC [Deltaproteobacteria bacterium]|nr:ribosome biogenesis GTP-binding protein YsxC [Deltaproteobacteria bacterium]